MEILTRAVELIYMLQGVPEADLKGTTSGTTTDAMKIKEAVDDGGDISTVHDLLLLGLDRFLCLGIASGSTYDHAEWLYLLTKTL